MVALLKCQGYWWATREARGADPRLVAASAEPRLSEHGPRRLMERDNSDCLCCLIDNGEKLRFQYIHALPFLSYCLHIDIFICEGIFKTRRIRMVWVGSANSSPMYGNTVAGINAKWLKGISFR